ncbi:MAG: 1,4-beta-xylanase [Sediminibacterium sp.]|nr:1,4-beta-xylanase [Sediminibacterium sp.]
MRSFLLTQRHRGNRGLAKRGGCWQSPKHRLHSCFQSNHMRKFLCIALFFAQAATAQNAGVWTADRANDWYAKQGWLTGANFLPSTAINQLEMWQADTFDTATINRELGWAQFIGFNTLRVFLHNLVWENDAAAFKQRINTFLAIADRHHIKPMFVFFDDCWNPEPVYGKQPDPRPGVHNSGWMRSPGQSVHNDSRRWAALETYVTDILSTYKNDKRILLWDLYNEPGNSGYGINSLPLVKKIFQWAWAVRPSQPLTVGVWFKKVPELNAFQLENSDVISFHNYDDTTSMANAIDTLQKRGRPVICTEYMARKNNSLFLTHLAVLKRKDVGAINWGLVNGKSNTVFPWNSKEGTPEPAVWFHDIFRKDGTPFDQNETRLITTLSGRK